MTKKHGSEIITIPGYPIAKTIRSFREEIIMKKKLVSFMLAASMIAGLCACGNTSTTMKAGLINT